MNATVFQFASDPPDALTQVTPASVVRTIALFPTATARFASCTQTSFNVSPPPGPRQAQLAPPFVEQPIVPKLPTATTKLPRVATFASHGVGTGIDGMSHDAPPSVVRIRVDPVLMAMTKPLFRSANATLVKFQNVLKKF